MTDLDKLNKKVKEVIESLPIQTTILSDAEFEYHYFPYNSDRVASIDEIDIETPEFVNLQENYRFTLVDQEDPETGTVYYHGYSEGCQFSWEPKEITPTFTSDKPSVCNIYYSDADMDWFWEIGDTTSEPEEHVTIIAKIGSTTKTINVVVVNPGLITG